MKKSLRRGLTALSMLAGIMSLPFVMFSPMLFDAPGSVQNPYAHLLFYSILLFPVLCFSGAFFRWLLRRHSWSPWFFVLPGLAVALVALSIFLLEFGCGGDFACTT
jgi:hypothetical protein